MGCISNTENKEECDKECDNKQLKSDIELSEKLTNSIITDFSPLQPLQPLPPLPPRSVDNQKNHIRIRVDIDEANDFVIIDPENESMRIENLEIKDNHVT